MFYYTIYNACSWPALMGLCLFLAAGSRQPSVFSYISYSTAQCSGLVVTADTILSVIL